MARIFVRDSSAGASKFWFSGDEKWVLSPDGQKLDVYRGGIHGRDTALHDHELLNYRKTPAEHVVVSRAGLRADRAVRAQAEAFTAEQAQLHSQARSLRTLIRSGRFDVTKVHHTVRALEGRNSQLRSHVDSLRASASYGKWTAADNAVRASESATRTARAMTDAAMKAQRASTEAAAVAARAQAELAAKTALVQAELAAKTARVSAEAAAKSARQAAEASAKTARHAAEATLRTLRVAAEAAARAARVAAEASAKAARAAAEATARAAAATAKAAAATAAAIASAIAG